MNKCRQCNLNFEGICDFYGEMPVEDAIMICDTDEFLQYSPEEDDEDDY